MIKDIRQERKERILEVLYKHKAPSDSISWEELARESGVSFSGVRRAVWELANNEKILVAINPNPPYGLYIKDELG